MRRPRGPVPLGARRRRHSDQARLPGRARGGAEPRLPVRRAVGFVVGAPLIPFLLMLWRPGDRVAHAELAGAGAVAGSCGGDHRPSFSSFANSTQDAEDGLAAETRASPPSRPLSSRGRDERPPSSPPRCGGLLEAIVAPEASSPTTTVGTPKTPRSCGGVGPRAGAASSSLAAALGDGVGVELAGGRDRDVVGIGQVAATEQAWRKAASANETVRPIDFAYVATRIASSSSPGRGSGQRAGASGRRRQRGARLGHPGRAHVRLRPRAAIEAREQAAEQDRLPFRLLDLGVAEQCG